MRPKTDFEMRVFKCNNPECEFLVITHHEAERTFPDSDCEICGWHDSVEDIGPASEFRLVHNREE